MSLRKGHNIHVDVDGLCRAFVQHSVLQPRDSNQFADEPAIAWKMIAKNILKLISKKISKKIKKDFKKDFKKISKKPASKGKDE